MAFTSEMLQSVQGSSTQAPAFNPNAFTMQNLPTSKSAIQVGASETGKFLNNTGEEAGNEIVDSFKKTPSNIGNDITQGASRIATDSQGTNLTAPLKTAGDIGETGLNIAGDTIKSLFAPITAAIDGLVKGGSDVISDSKTVQNVATSPIINLLANKGGQLDAAVKANPRAAQDLGNALNILMATAGEATGAPEENLKVSDVKDLTNDVVNKAKSAVATLKESVVPTKTAAVPEDTLSSRIKDATPHYDQKMNLTNVKAPDTVDAEGNVVKGKTVPRIAGEGKGLNGERPVTTSASEHAAGTELNNVKDYPDKGTALEKGLATQKAISSEAENMRGSLKAEDTASPLDAKAEKIKVSNLITEHLPEDIQSKLDVLNPEENEMLKGMSAKAGSPQPEGGKFDLRGPGDIPKLPKTAAGRYYTRVLEALRNYNGTREGKLDLRQEIDGAFKSEGGKYAYGSDSQNALQEVHSDIRDAINKDLGKTAKNTDTQASLRKQMNLYRAADVLTAKAQAESATAYGRLEQKYPTLRNLSRIAQRQGIMLPLKTLETLAGLGLIGGYLRKEITGSK